MTYDLRSMANTVFVILLFQKHVSSQPGSSLHTAGIFRVASFRVAAFLNKYSLSWLALLRVFPFVP